MNVRKKLDQFYFFFPVQLVAIQIRNHKSILTIWFLLFLMVGNAVGSEFGITFLFLDPEYLGDVNFWSLFIVGAGIGIFIASYQIAMYILDSYRFHFLALEKHPFFLFAINNMLLPVAFVIFYIISFIRFQMDVRGGFESAILLYLSALILGILSLLLFIGYYFFRTNKNIFKVFGTKLAQELRNPKAILDKAKVGINVRYRVDTLLTGFTKIGTVDKSIRADFRTLVRVLNQNHGNALLIELVLLTLIMALGLVDHNPVFQIPTATSLLLFFSLILMLLAAFAFWFRKIGILTFLLAIAGYFILSVSGYFEERHPAYGMDYECAPAAYNANSISAIASPDNIYSDFRNTISILDTWKQDVQIFHGSGKLPKVVFLCVSGGGLRASYFTLRSLQVLDSLTDKDFFAHTRLITGASGGAIGAAVFRELDLRRQRDSENARDRVWADRMAKDLLNRISFRIVTGSILPNLSTRVGDQQYASDRGYAFDDQLRTNLDLFHDTRLADYAKPESEGIIPILIMSPICINDGRKMYISSTPVSFLSRNMDGQGGVESGITGIEFRRFFRDQDADSVLFVTALRMNASFPLITPYVQLPSEPVIRAIDAGIVDNFGILTSVKYLHVFRDWFAANTSGVMFVQIRDSRREVIRRRNQDKSWLAMLDPVGNTYSSYMMSKDVALDDHFDFAKSWFRGNLEMVTIEYRTDEESAGHASLNWHLTVREKEDIENAVFDQGNSAAMHYISKWLVQ